jgi:hypothetical protein
LLDEQEIQASSCPFAYFYCARDPSEPDCGSGEKIIPSLLRQLATVGPDTAVAGPVRQHVEKIQREKFPDRDWTAEECSLLITKLMDTYPVVTMVIDALDECELIERATLLDFIAGMIKDSAKLVKVFITSRDDLDIVASMIDSSDLKIRADLNAPDIGCFIDEKMAELEKYRTRLYGSMSSFLRETVSSTLKSGAHGM